MTIDESARVGEGECPALRAGEETCGSAGPERLLIRGARPQRRWPSHIERLALQLRRWLFGKAKGRRRQPVLWPARGELTTSFDVEGVPLRWPTHSIPLLKDIMHQSLSPHSARLPPSCWIITDGERPLCVHPRGRQPNGMERPFHQRCPGG